MSRGLWETTVGKKVAMAATGLLLVGFVLGHMAGNLKAFLGPDSFNHYAEWLRVVGEPALPRGVALWLARVVLLAAVVVHIVAAVQLARRSRAARPQGYEKEDSLTFSYASRTMRWGGVIIALFVVYHILHFTTGTAHRDFVAGEPYRNLVVGFSSPLVVGVYLLAIAALSFHLYHGIWSVFQTFGIAGSARTPWRRSVAAGVAGVLFVGFMAVPFGVLLGLITLP
ncbi:MAG: succinate dehydrogenase cytochrome b subunit [Gemmatimonadota bacterium]|nr:succinate dehydrogenase cytochrome b subunit [Gemmatimonadota bacterium]